MSDDIDYLIYAQQRHTEMRRKVMEQEIAMIDYQNRVAMAVRMNCLLLGQTLGMLYSAFNPNLYRSDAAGERSK